MAKTLKGLHLDELRRFAVRDPELLSVGDKVLFVHLPDVDVESERTLPFGSPHAQTGTLKEIAFLTYAELEPNSKLESEPELVLRFRSESGSLEYSYAADSGVIPYGDAKAIEEGRESYNTSNFTVRLAELKEQGFAPLLSVTEGYAKRLELWNAELKAARDSLYGSPQGLSSARLIDYDLLP